MKNLILKSAFLLLSFLAIVLFSCDNNGTLEVPKDNVGDSTNTDNLRSIVLIYTNDEHGWLEPTDSYSGASGMMGSWKKEVGYDASDDKFLVLSGGDMWTGPAISTWFQGEPMVEIMNKMGYDAAALGNHEFDFAVSNIETREQQMNFPMLSANIRSKSTNEIPDFVKPYFITEVNGIKVGIIGLSSLSTPRTAFPKYVEDYKFIPYSEAVAEFAPKAKSEGAELVFIIGHICKDEMESLLPIAKQYNIPVIAGGHCHRRVLSKSDDILIVQSGSYMKGYTKIALEYDLTTKKAEVISYKAIDNTGSETDTEIEEIVTYWQQEAQGELSVEIGYCSQNISRYSASMGNMITDSWLVSFPNDDIAFTNSGGIRQDIPQGKITVGTVVGVLPFSNEIVRLELTGTQIMQVANGYVLGGMSIVNGYRLSDGTAIEPDSIYTVLTTDYAYSVSNSLQNYDATAESTSVNWRQPMIEWITSLNTTEADPLNNYLDDVSRK